MPKLKMGPIFQSDIDMGDTISIDRVSVYRLRTGKVAKSMRTYLLYSAAASMIKSDYAMFAGMKPALDAIQRISILFQQWEISSNDIPENPEDIKNAVFAALPNLAGLFASLDEVKTERLIFLALWGYYNLGDSNEENSN